MGQASAEDIGMAAIAGTKPANVKAMLAGKPVEAQLAVANGRATVEFAQEITIGAGQALSVEWGNLTKAVMNFRTPN